VESPPGDQGDTRLFEGAGVQHRIEVRVVVAVPVLGLSIHVGPGAQLQGIARRPVVGELGRESLEIFHSLEARATGEGIGLVVGAPRDTELAISIVHGQAQLRVIRRHPADPREGIPALPVGVLAQRGVLEGRRVEVARHRETVAVEYAPGGEDVQVAGGAGDRRLAQELVPLPRVAGQAAVDALLAAAGADLEHATDGSIAVQHRAVAVGELDVFDDLDRNHGGVELPVLGIPDRDAVDEQQHVAGAKPPHVDARHAVGAGADDHSGQAHQHLVQGSRALLADVLLVHTPRGAHVLHQIALRGHGLLVDGPGRSRGCSRERASGSRSGCGRGNPREHCSQSESTSPQQAPPQHCQSPTQYRERAIPERI
jgi:hypothetical protein